MGHPPPLSCCKWPIVKPMNYMTSLYHPTRPNLESESYVELPIKIPISAPCLVRVQSNVSLLFYSKMYFDPNPKDRMSFYSKLTTLCIWKSLQSNKISFCPAWLQEFAVRPETTYKRIFIGSKPYLENFEVRRTITPWQPQALVPKVSNSR